ncbi:MAG: ATP-binding cassette domain-containing protein [Chloroflexota bacterium]|nr:ATP-binding cassette domain-containing protein [Chloroflexota bacterium]
MKPIVSIENLYYAYPPLKVGAEPIPVLKGVSLSLAQGECLALLGPTGAGKSTLCLTLNGIIPHLTGGTFRGEVRVAEHDTREMDPGELSQRVGLVFQDPKSQLFNMTVEDEVAFGPESLALPPGEIEARIDEALKTMGISDLRHRSPLELSGGQKQRVALAAILAMRPEVLVLDEPTASLDPAGKRSVLEAMRHLRERTQMAILWVTQDVDKVPLLADRVAVLGQGKILLNGKPAEVFGQAEKLRDLGLALPRMRQLAIYFNEREESGYTWLTVEEAACDLGEDTGG